MNSLTREFVNEKLKRDLKRQLRQGSLKANQLILTDEQLAGRYKISLVSVRRAIRDLVNEGLLYRVQGKGTFVSQGKIGHQLYQFVSTTRSMQERGLVPSTRIISQKIITADKDIAGKLKIRAKEKAFELIRLRLGNNVPLILETIYIPEKLCPGLIERNLEAIPLHELISERYGLRVAGSRQSFETVLIGEKEAELLKIKPGSLGILMEEIMCLEDKRIIEWTKSIYRSDKFKFETKWGEI